MQGFYTLFVILNEVKNLLFVKEFFVALRMTKGCAIYKIR